jgi:predicted dehydrogenase
LIDSLLIVGYGRQGHRHLDVALRFDLAQLIVTVDPRFATRTGAGKHFTDLATALEYSGYDAAIVASPTTTHAEIVETLLRRNVPTLVEKPIAADFAQGEALIELMNSTGTALFVGYVERFNPVVRLLGDVMRSGVIGGPISMVMKRFGIPASEPQDADVIHDLSVHDIDLVCNLNAAPRLLGAGGRVDHSTGQIHTAQLLLRSDDLTVGIESSRMAARRERTISVLTEKAYLVADLLGQHMDVLKSPSQSFDDGELAAFATVSPHDLGMRLAPRTREPLADELKALLASLSGGPDPMLATPQSALAVSFIADAASAMIMEADPTR